MLFPSSPINLLDPATLETNRMGRLTPEQEAWLRTVSFGGSGFAAALPIIIVVPMLCFFGFIFLQDGFTDAWIILPFVGLFLTIVLWRTGPALFDGVQRALKLRSDRQSGIIRQSMGELAFGRDGYVAQSGERQLFLPFSEPGGLLPGVRYTFFHFEESGIVLSAEQLGTASTAAIRAGLNRILAAANNFSAEDLDANQRGEISPAQHSRLMRKLLAGLALAFIFTLVGAGVIFGASSADGFEAWPILIIFLAVFGVFAAIGIYTVINSVMDMNALPEVMEGRGSRHTERRSSGRSSRTVYFYDIGNLKFEVSYRAYKVLMEEFDYRVHYAPRTKTLLSIEVAEVPNFNW